MEYTGWIEVWIFNCLVNQAFITEEDGEIEAILYIIHFQSLWTEDCKPKKH